MSTNYVGHITALHFHSESTLLAVSGRFVSLHCIHTAAQLDLVQIPERAHDLKPTASKNDYVAICGKSLTIITIKNNKFLKVTTFTCEDWIMDAKRLLNGDYAVLIAHNHIQLRAALTFEIIREIRCEQKCQIYSGALFGDCWDSLLVASGTILQHILVWGTQSSRIAHRFVGHEGAIFNLQWNSTGSILASVSDDRTIRLWDVIDGIGQTHCFQGHTSRIWKTRFCNDLIISVSEDASCRVWNLLTGECESCWEGHLLSNVWSLAINSTNKIVATGGGDGAIRLWDLNASIAQNSSSPIHTVIVSSDHVVKRFSTLNSDMISIVTDAGAVLIHSLIHGSTNQIHFDELFRGWTAFSTYKSDFLVVGGMFGDILILSPTNLFSPIKIRVCQAKIMQFFLKEVSEDCIIIHVFSRNEDPLKRIKIELKRGNEPEVTFLKDISLPPKFNIMSLDTYKDTWLVLGSRLGALFICNLHSQGPAILMQKLHGSDAVCSLRITSVTNESLNVQSVGRDGCYCICTISLNSFEGNNWTITKTHESKITKGWLSQVFEVEGQTIVTGFYDERFFVYNYTKQYQVWAVECGGGHREWEFKIHGDQQNLKMVDLKSSQFVFIRKEDLQVSKISLQRENGDGDSLFGSPILRESYHGLETRCVQIFGVGDDGCRLIVSGGEDGVLTIHSYNDHKMTRVISCRKHLAAIRCVSVQACSPNEKYIFSGGVRQILKCWKLTSNGCGYECVDYLTATFTGISDRIQSRVMGIDTVRLDACKILVGIACSDGYIRLFIFQTPNTPAKSTFTMICESKHHGKCVQKFKVFKRDDEVYCISAATDGNVLIWKMQKSVLTFADSPIVTVKMHQSGVKALDYRLVDGGLLEICTGGDDGDVGYVAVDLPLAKIERKINTLGHCSSVTGVTFTGAAKIGSVSIDYRLSEWEIGNRLTLLRETTIDVPDASDMSYYEGVCAVVGHGIQTFKI